MKTDTELKLALMRLLPDTIVETYPCDDRPMEEVQKAGEVKWYWLEYHREILGTELLHVCWLVEQSLERGKDAGAECYRYAAELYRVVDQENQPCMASWQQRATALCKVKGIE